MKSTQLFPALALVICGAASCQKVIEIKPNAFTQKYVIEGEVTDAPGPYTIRVSRTRSVSDDNSFETIDDAQVVIEDRSSGETDTLQSSGSGAYRTTRIAGAAGHTYMLTVRVGAETFIASSALPAAAKVVVDKSDSTVSLVDAGGRVYASFPATTGSEDSTLASSFSAIAGSVMISAVSMARTLATVVTSSSE